MRYDCRIYKATMRPVDAGGRGQVVHADSAEAALQEQALRSTDDGLTRAAASGLCGGLVREFQNFQARSAHGAALATPTPSSCRASRRAFAAFRSAVSNPSVNRS
jgi:hypothetical protein